MIHHLPVHPSPIFTPSTLHTHPSTPQSPVNSLYTLPVHPSPQFTTSTLHTPPSVANRVPCPHLRVVSYLCSAEVFVGVLRRCVRVEVQKWCHVKGIKSRPGPPRLSVPRDG
ncbi:hypothetical protein O3P69_005386 [Scylla paramamosain]|uniref:Uncharacterized protein n=1 Tax=Scylla paramamosain TaxID=85552 RepID=A0AAW0UDE5_SCYPA